MVSPLLLPCLALTSWEEEEATENIPHSQVDYLQCHLPLPPHTPLAFLYLVSSTSSPSRTPRKKVLMFTLIPRKHMGCVTCLLQHGRGERLRKTDGSPIQHGDQIMKLLTAMMKALAIIKCAAHQKSGHGLPKEKRQQMRQLSEGLQ